MRHNIEKNINIEKILIIFKLNIAKDTRAATAAVAAVVVCLLFLLILALKPQ